MTKFLYEEYDILSKRISKEIPAFMSDNLSQKFSIRPYQVETFARFFDYLKNYEEKTLPIHLLFNMATGSGKTLIMAGLILYLYQQGYRNFLFFVHSNNIIEKTKNNFLTKESSKYLFAEKIILDGKVVNIEQVANFEGVNSQNINICFTTIHQLHYDLHNVKENAITFENFREHKIVLLSDEAHHSQATTKQKMTLGEALEKPSWENTVEKILQQNKANLLLEFTATLDFLNKNIVEKYEPKIIYRYDLKEFRSDGYSKEIDLLQSDFEEEDRILQAVILSQYRQELAGKHKINLKPIILFKAQKTIEESKQNQAKFDGIIENLSVKDIERIRRKSQIELIRQAFRFFAENKTTDALLVKILKQNFSPNKCLNVNEENLDKKTLKKQDRQELISQQRLLNSLEDNDNQIRAIFAVQKLNEGWDVLNLFDIVRLYETRQSGGRVTAPTTIAEAQLIGRGARYFPFSHEAGDDKYKRKFDKNLANELRVIEMLHYHSISDHRYIAELKTALKKEGLIDDDEITKELKLKEEFKKTEFYKTGIIYKNEAVEKNKRKIKSLADLGVKSKNISYLIHSGEGKDAAVFEDFALEVQSVVKTKDVSLKEIPVHIIRSALARNDFYRFINLKTEFPILSSIANFIKSKDFLAGLSITFSGMTDTLANLHNTYLFEGASKLLAEIEREIKSNSFDYEGGEFQPAYIHEVFKDKLIKMRQGDTRADGQFNFVKNKDWYVFDNNYGTSEEKSLVEFMARQIDEMSPDYKKVYLIRNELHFKIHNFKDGEAFAPDFVLFLIQKNGKQLTYQIFIEPKGGHLEDKDRWKEDFLLEIREKFKNRVLTFKESTKYRIVGVPFYKQEEENKFKEELLVSIK